MQALADHYCALLAEPIAECFLSQIKSKVKLQLERFKKVYQELNLLQVF